MLIVVCYAYSGVACPSQLERQVSWVKGFQGATISDQGVVSDIRACPYRTILA